MKAFNQKGWKPKQTDFQVSTPTSEGFQISISTSSFSVQRVLSSI